MANNSVPTDNASPSFNIKTFFFWMVSAIALIALADPFPKLAIVLAWILILGVLLTHWSDYVGYLSPPK